MDQFSKRANSTIKPEITSNNIEVRKNQSK
jgi:hypothetical protein